MLSIHDIRIIELSKKSWYNFLVIEIVLDYIVAIKRRIICNSRLYYTTKKGVSWWYSIIIIPLNDIKITEINQNIKRRDFLVFISRIRNEYWMILYNINKYIVSQPFFKSILSPWENSGNLYPKSKFSDTCSLYKHIKYV